jgi:hypothetical protein
MKAHLYNHPKLFKWPPDTGGSYGSNTVFPLPGQATLRAVSLLEPIDDQPRHLSIVIEFRGDRSSGEIYFADQSDEEARRKLHTFLKTQIGKEINDISVCEVDL